MTLSTDYIDWMMAEPREGFRRRLNEEKSAWNEGDWLVIDDEEIGRKVYCIGGDEDPKVVVADWESYGVVQWLPDLGQLLDLVEEAKPGRATRLASDPSAEAASRYWCRHGRAYGSGSCWKIAASELLAKLWGME